MPGLVPLAAAGAVAQEVLGDEKTVDGIERERPRDHVGMASVGETPGLRRPKPRSAPAWVMLV